MSGEMTPALCIGLGVITLFYYLVSLCLPYCKMNSIKKTSDISKALIPIFKYWKEGQV